MMGGDNPFGGGNPFGGNNPFGGGNPFGGNNPFGGGNPFAAPQTSNDNPFASNPFSAPAVATEPAPSSDDLNIDDLIKKIDSKIAELEDEEKKELESRDNKEDTSEKTVVEEAIEHNNNEISSNDNVLSSDAIISNNKVDFKGLSSIQEDKPKAHDIMDDYLEDFNDISEDGSEKIESQTDDIKEAIIEESNSSNNKEFDMDDMALQDNSITNIDNKSIVEEASNTNSDGVYVNKEEVDKIMNEKDEEDLFDDFFE